jgi:prepilin-type N-terminal cleavage/methylation domain-containing protein
VLHGFGLFELVVVLAIIGLVAAIAVPRFGASVARFRAESAARRIVADLAMARATARQTSQGTTILFDLAADCVRIPSAKPMDHGAGQYEDHLGDTPYNADLVSTSFGGGNQVTFDGYGIPNAEGTIVVGAGDVQKTIFLSQCTGLATIQREVTSATGN